MVKVSIALWNFSVLSRCKYVNTESRCPESWRKVRPVRRCPSLSLCHDRQWTAEVRQSPHGSKVWSLAQQKPPGNAKQHRGLRPGLRWQLLTESPARWPSGVTTTESDRSSTSTLVPPYGGTLQVAPPQPLPVFHPQIGFSSLDFQNTLGMLRCLVFLRLRPCDSGLGPSRVHLGKSKYLHVMCPRWFKGTLSCFTFPSPWLLESTQHALSTHSPPGTVQSTPAFLTSAGGRWGHWGIERLSDLPQVTS